MPDWDDDGPQLFANLREAQRSAAEHALARRAITLEAIKAWHATTMRGLDIEHAARLAIDPADLVGELRGPPKLSGIEVRVDGHPGVGSENVASECRRLVDVLGTLIDRLDALLPADRLDELDGDGLQAVAEVAAWAHAEWVRIHPFANGNGRTSRLLGNAILVRYGLRPVFRLRPRPDGTYLVAASQAMSGDHRPMTDYVLAQLLQR